MDKSHRSECNRSCQQVHGDQKDGAVTEAGWPILKRHFQRRSLDKFLNQPTTVTHCLHAK